MMNEANEKICLCIDTSTKVASVCAAKSLDGKAVEILNYSLVNDGLTHSENLIPMINSCLSACKLSSSDVDVFACINGPGSFTGLRIGISTANAMAQSTGREIIGIDALDALAYTFKHFNGLVIPMIDARRDNAFCAVFDGAKSFKKTVEDDVKSVDELLEIIKDYDGNIMFLGDGASKAHNRAKTLFADRAIFADGISNCVNASMGAEMALKTYFENGMKGQKVLLPNYVKGTSAKTVAERNAEK